MAQAGTTAATSTASMEAVEGQLEDVAGDALKGAAAMRAYREQVDEVGDESAEAAAQTATLGTALRSAAVAAGEASVNVGPFNTSVRRAVVALPAMIGLVGSLGAALWGVTIAAGAAAGALGLLFAGGLVGLTETMVENSADLETRMAALEELMVQFGGAVDQATEPLQDMANQEMAMDTLLGLATLIGDVSNSVAHLESVFAQAGAVLGNTFWLEEARGIAELETMVRQLMPILQDMTFYVLTKLPDLLAWLRTETLKVAPAFGDFAVSLVPVLANLIQFSGTILRLTLPALSLLINAITPVLAALAAMPDALVAASIAFVAATVVLSAYDVAAIAANISTWSLVAAIDALIASIATLLAPITVTVVAIAALIAAVVGAITYFGLWGDILNVLIGTWNALVELVELSVNAFIGLSKWLENLLGPLLLLVPGFGMVMWVVANFNEIVTTAQRVIEKTQQAWENFVKSVMKYVGPVLDAIGRAEKKVDESGGVELDSAKLDTPAATSKGGPSRDEDGGGAGGPGSGPGAEARSQQLQGNREEYNFDFSNSNIGGDLSERDIERVVEKALNKKKEKNSDR